MEITEVRVAPRVDGKLKGFASITLEDCFVVRGLKIIEGIIDGMEVIDQTDGRVYDVLLEGGVDRWLGKGVP